MRYTRLERAGRIWIVETVGWSGETRARMTTLAVLMLATLTMLACAASAEAAQPGETYERVTSEAGPVAWFRFSDPVGSSMIEDAVGTHAFTASNHGIVLGGAGPFAGSESGVMGESEPYATLPSNPLSSAKEFTVEAWVYRPEAGHFKQAIFSIGSSSSNYMYMTPASSGSGHTAMLEIHPSSGSVLQVTAPKLQASEWGYMAATETSSGVATLYMNGQPGTSVQTTVFPASLGSSLEAFLAKSFESGRNLQGSLSNVAFYTKALSANEIRERFDVMKVPINSSPPMIENGELGKTATAGSGAWVGESPITYAYVWQRCKEEGMCENIPGGTGSTISVTSEDEGYSLRVLVKAKNTYGQGEAYSVETAVIGGSPENTEPPKITGEASEDMTLSASTGSWAGAEPIEYTYQWELCNSFGEGCFPVPGEAGKGTEYKLGASEAGDTMRITVTARNSAGAGEATSAVSAEVSMKPGTAAVAWGKNGPASQLGAGYEDDYEVSPVPVVGLSDIRSVLAAGLDSYALLGGGTVVAWGDNPRGQLGDGSTESSGSPETVLERTEGGGSRTMTGVTAIAVSYGASVHGMALVNDSEHHGEVMTWGASEYGERGNGEYNYNEQEYNVEAGGPIVPREEAIAVPALEHVTAIAAGGSSDFALQEDEPGKTTLWTWGADNGEKLGVEEGHTATTCKAEAVNSYPCSPKPLQVPLPKGVEVTGISAGKTAVYAILSDGRVLAWGENAYGQLGDGTTETTSQSGSTFHYVCAIGHEGACMQEAEELKHVKAVSGGRYFALALLEGGEVAGWGAGGGALSGKSTEQCRKHNLDECQLTPKKVLLTSEGSPLQGVTAISTGDDFSLALANVIEGEGEGIVYAFGNNERGQLGLGTGLGPDKCTHSVKNKGSGSGSKEAKAPCAEYPTKIPGLSDVGSISAGEFEPGEGHSLAFVRSGGPELQSAFTVTPGVEHEGEREKERDVLKVAWRLSAPYTAPNLPEYKLKWQQEPSGSNAVKADEDRERIEAYEAEETAVEEALAEAEEAKDEEAVKEDNTKLEEIPREIEREAADLKRCEEALEEEYPHKTATINMLCEKESKGECTYTVNEAAVEINRKKQLENLSSDTPYKITLTRVGAAEEGEAEVAHIIGTTLP